MRGTRFGIGVDPADGLLRQGAEGYQLTWMDAKVDDWVVTPRRGKAVEINALWYNALRLLDEWLREERRPTRRRPLREHADRAARVVQRAVLDTTTAAICTTSSTASSGDDRGVPAEPDLRDLARRIRCSTSTRWRGGARRRARRGC